jgi:hypothetical protein
MNSHDDRDSHRMMWVLCTGISSGFQQISDTLLRLKNS